ncbi:DUF6602 domain-containing protein [Streptomyces niveus]|uniref:DUF6602 domain-containing protein n=1 Tax=Streptomyces niveus TaxID=193462 RepID=UPI003657BC22
MPRYKLDKILGSVAKRMHADFEQSQNFNHNGEAGASREILIKNFLSVYLPSHVEAIHNAEVISANGETSPQCDIVIIDRDSPPFTTLEGYRIVPNECVYGMVEVKTNLDGNEIIDACEKISKLRNMAKVSYRPIPNMLPRVAKAYGITYEHFPTSGMIVAFNGLKLETLGNHLVEWCRTRDPVEWPDSIWVAGKGYLQWRNPKDGSLSRSPEPGAVLAQVDVSPEQDILLPLALHLNVHFSDAWMHPLNLIPYSGVVPLGNISKQWKI